MEALAGQVSHHKTKDDSMPARKERCLACGTDQMKPRRRYCSNECRQQINWVLSLSKGLLKAFNARYAAFSFTGEHVILDVLPIWSKGISRFVSKRNNGNRPAADLKNLILQAGKEWHYLVNNKNSKSYASLFLLQKSHMGEIDPNSIKPNRKASPKLSIYEKNCLKLLKLERKDLCASGQMIKIKSAYRKMAKLYHPDMGGDEEKFKQLTLAHERMLMWAGNPQYVSRKALDGCWSYDGSTNKWSPPL